MQLIAQTDDRLEQERCDWLFAADVQAKVAEITQRGYISVEAGTCDYAVMFVPSEAVFDYINRQHLEIVGQALSERVIMASPYSLVAIVRTISEAYRNFYYETSMRAIVAKVDTFLNDFRLFQEEFSKFGKPSARHCGPCRRMPSSVAISVNLRYLSQRAGPLGFAG